MNWVLNRRRKPVPIGGSGGDAYMAWTITNPGELSGSGLDTVYSDFITIPEPVPTGEGLFSVPGMTLHTTAGGVLVGYVEFWSDDELLSEFDIASISAVEQLVDYTSYGLGTGGAGLNVSASEAGTFYSAGVAVGPIPAGSGLVTGGGSLGGYGLLGMVPADSVNDAVGTASGSLELLDAADNVLVTIDLITSTATINKPLNWLTGATPPAPGLGVIGDYYNDYEHSKWYGPKTVAGWGTGRSPPLAADPNNVITKDDAAAGPAAWAGSITKARSKLVISTATNCSIGLQVFDLCLWRFN